MGSIGDAYDNAMGRVVLSVLQRELLDEQRWPTRRQLALTVFEWIEACYNSHRRHTAIGSLSPIDYETVLAADRSRRRHEPIGSRNRALNRPQRPAITAGGEIHRRIEPLRTVADPTPEPSGKAGDGQPSKDSRFWWHQSA